MTSAAAKRLVRAGVFAAAVLACASVYAQAAPPALPRLPLIEVPASGDGDTFVVLYSGDIGWGATARHFAQAFAAAGEPVAGIDSLRYYLKRRSPDAAAADLAAVIARYAEVWNRPKVILVGYSFGADGLPLVVQQLAADARARVRLMALISPTDRADMAFRGLSWFDMTLPNARPLAPALLTLGAIPAVCIHAAYDPRQACDRFPPQVITSVALPGNHRYHGESEAVARVILTAAGLAPPPPP